MMLVNMAYDDQTTVRLEDDERPAVVRLNHMPRPGDMFVTCRGNPLEVTHAEVRLQSAAEAPAGLPSGHPYIWVADPRYVTDQR